MSEKKSKYFYLLLLPLFLYILLIGVMPLLEPDESRYSDIPSAMNGTGDYVTPKLHHVVYLEKPPLAYWATALSFRLFGESDFSSRLFVALCAWGCILLAYSMGSQFDDRRTGLYSAGILGTFLFHFLIGKIHILDMPLTFFVCLALWCGYLYLTRTPRKRLWIYLVYAVSALAVLTKGLIGLVFPFAILFIWLLIERRWRDLPKLISPVGIVLFLLMTLPWVALVQRANPDFLWFFFVQEHFLRYTTTMHGRDGFYLYFVPVILAGSLPWLAYLPKAMKEGKASFRNLFSKDQYSFLLTWFLFIFLFYSVSSSKLIPYIGPVFLPLAVIFGRLFRSAEENFQPGRGRLAYNLPVYLQSLLFILALLAPPFLKNMKMGQDLVIMYSRNWWYLITIPVIVLFLMTFVPDWIRSRWRTGWFASICVLSALLLGSLIFPASDFLKPYKSAYPAAEAVRKYLPAGQDLYQYKIALYGVDYYNKIRTPIVDDFGELGFGIQKLPEAERNRYFLSSPEFYRLCRTRKELYCLTQYRERLEELKKELPNLEILWDNGAFFLVRITS